MWRIIEHFEISREEGFCKSDLTRATRHLAWLAGWTEDDGIQEAVMRGESLPPIHQAPAQKTMRALLEHLSAEDTNIQCRKANGAEQSVAPDPRQAQRSPQRVIEATRGEIAGQIDEEGELWPQDTIDLEFEAECRICVETINETNPMARYSFKHIDDSAVPLICTACAQKDIQVLRGSKEPKDWSCPCCPAKLQAEDVLRYADAETADWCLSPSPSFSQLPSNKP